MASDEHPSAGLALVVQGPRAEASLWRRLRLGKETRCRRLLFDRHVAFARRVARHQWRRWPAEGLERVDFEQLAYGALLEAIDRFDPLRNIPFEAFALPRLRGAIADGARRASEAGTRHAYQRKLRAERLRALRSTAPANADPVAELAEIAALLAIGLITEGAVAPANAGTGYESQRWRELERSVLAEIAHLDDSERTVIEQHYLYGAPFTVIAAALQLTPGRISQLHRSALARLRGRLKRSE